MLDSITRSWQTDATTEEDDQHNIWEGSGEVDSLQTTRKDGVIKFYPRYFP